MAGEFPAVKRFPIAAAATVLLITALGRLLVDGMEADDIVTLWFKSYAVDCN